MKPDISIIIPLYNEAQRLPVAMPAIINWVERHNAEVILVPNGCTDNTGNLCWDYATHKDVYWVASSHGKGAAIGMGMRFAQGQWRYMCDVDLSTPITELDKFIEASARADVVIGVRQRDAHTAPLRRLAHAAFNMSVHSILPGISDTQCGFKLFSEAAADYVFQRMTLSGWAFDVEALYLARMGGFEIVEIPVEWNPNPDSRVHLATASVEMFWDVMSIPNRHSN